MSQKYLYIVIRAQAASNGGVSEKSGGKKKSNAQKIYGRDVEWNSHKC